MYIYIYIYIYVYIHIGASCIWASRGVVGAVKVRRRDGGDEELAAVGVLDARSKCELNI